MFKLNSFLFLFSLVFLSCISFPLVNAEVETLGTFKQYGSIDLSQTCDNCTYINLTRVKYPINSEQEIINKGMTEGVSGNFNYSFSNTTQLGNYIVTTCGDPNGVYTCDDYDFNITTTGNQIYVYILLFLLVGGLSLLFLGAHFNAPIIGFSSGILFSIAGVFSIIYGLGLINNLYTNAVGYVSLFMGIAISFSAASEYFIE